jgi:hypothetical protein
MKRSLSVLFVLLSAAACVAVAEPAKDKGRFAPTPPGKDQGPTSLRQPGKPPAVNEFRKEAAERAAREEKLRAAADRQKELEHRKKMPAPEGRALAPVPPKGNARDWKALTADDFRKHAASGELDAGRKGAHDIAGRPVTLTPARLKSVDDLHAGPRVLGLFRTEQPTEQLPAGEYDLILAGDGAAWRVYAARRDGTEVFEAKDVRVRLLERSGPTPANEVRHGSLIFIMYYVIDYPMVVPQYGPWWAPYPSTTVVWVPQLVQVVFYFP